MARDITEGDDGVYVSFDGSGVSTVARGIADIGIQSTSTTWQNTDVAYDVAVGGLPFIYAINDSRPYIRQTAPFRKDQFDNGQEPGEQSLTGWWIRSQASFHSGTGIKFYDPAQTDEVGHYRFTDSRNLDVWTKGQVTLLKETTNMTGVTTGTYKLISAKSNSTDVVIGYIPGTNTIKSFTADGTVLATYSYGNNPNHNFEGIFNNAVCTDGTRLFLADTHHIYVGAITSSNAGWARYYETEGTTILAWVKQRLVAAVGNSIYELTGVVGPSSNKKPDPVYTHPNTSWVWTSISESGGAIYAAGYAGGNSAIYKFTLTSNGGMPTLTSGVVAAQLPIGETVNKIEYYLGYLMLGTNRGVRAAVVSDQDGSIQYGPLIIEESNGVYDFAFRDRYVWVTGSVAGFAGLYRIDLGNELETLRFAYATDAHLEEISGYATSVDFVGNTNQVAFTTSGSNGIAIQSTSTLANTGYLTTGYIRYGTLEPKNFKRLLGRGDFTHGSMTLATIDKNNIEYDHISYDANILAVEVGTSKPASAQEYVAYKFTFYRDAGTSTLGPIFKGYQAKATIATPRQRIMKFPVYCFDTETDKYNTVIGYEGRAFDRIQSLEDLEENGDVLTWQDLSTGEIRQAVIEQITFTRMTPPDKRFDGFGGVLEITIRTV